MALLFQWDNPDISEHDFVLVVLEFDRPGVWAFGVACTGFVRYAVVLVYPHIILKYGYTGVFDFLAVFENRAIESYIKALPFACHSADIFFGFFCYVN